ncbi:MAG: hypothetical protein DU429_01730 [Candidatus Tokpelaia sp.]|nr:MAG: hypothetical protein DU430_03360 [Candidatus Tokpelaia sp.]KAA6207773.1 MAG: hypothetical protein DU429_01730 [Candidatus Tokpelaia sp.]KAA6404949.1 hypothetical protein DPQ22_08685 [Candidatus Tokpelaia sp.]
MSFCGRVSAKDSPSAFTAELQILAARPCRPACILVSYFENISPAAMRCESFYFLQSNRPNFNIQVTMP